MKKPHTLEKHSLGTLAQRFKGLAARNSLAAWLTGGRLTPLMTDKTAAPYLFERDALDRLGRDLEKSHEELLSKLETNPAKFQAIRDRARQNALTRLDRNERLEKAGRPDLAMRDLEPATNPADAMGATQLSGRPRGWTVSTNAITGKKWKGLK